MKSIIGLVELGGNQVPVIPGSSVQALSEVAELVWALGQCKLCDMTDINELKDAVADGFNVIGFQQWYGKFAFFCYSHTNGDGTRQCYGGVCVFCKF